MEFRLKKTYSEEDYRKILTIINAFRAIKTENGWYLGREKYKALVDSFKLNIGEDPTEPLYIPSYVHQVIIQEDKITKDLAAILKKAQYDFDMGIWSMNDELFKLFTQYCEQNNISFYVVKDSEKVDIFEKEIILSKLEYIENELERIHSSYYLDNLTLEELLKSLNENQIKIAEALKIKVDKVYEEVTVKENNGDKVTFYYISTEPMILFIFNEDGKRTIALHKEDLVTLPRQVAEELVKLNRGKILESKGTGTQGPEGT